MTLRREQPSDHRAVELLTREAFWGMSGPRCDEPLLVHRLRGAACFVPELDLVAEIGEVLVGHVVYSRAAVVGERSTWEVLTFGPLSVLPAYQGTGVGSALMRRSLADAAQLGHRAVVVYGHPDYYPRFGFRRATEVGITAPGGVTIDALMALELVPGGLDDVQGEFHEDPVFHLDPADSMAFDAELPPKEPAPPAPLGVLEERVPTSVLEAVRARGVRDVGELRRYSAAEVASWEGVGPSGSAALRDALREGGVRWGAAAPVRT